MYSKIEEMGLITRLDHAAYLGRELAKAEIALVTGKEYIQDSHTIQALTVFRLVCTLLRVRKNFLRILSSGVPTIVADDTRIILSMGYTKNMLVHMPGYDLNRYSTNRMSHYGFEKQVSHEMLHHGSDEKQDCYSSCDFCWCKCADPLSCFTSQR